MELINILIGVIILALGAPLGNLLARLTKEELKSGKVWFKILIITSLLVGVIGMILKDDVLMFSCFFIAIVTSQSLRK